MNENVLFPILLKIFIVNRTTNMAILFLGFICQNIGSRALRISQICFSRQELSNEHTMSIVQFWIFNLNIGVVELLWAGGIKTQRRAAIFGKHVSVMTGHFIFAFQLARPKKCFVLHPNEVMPFCAQAILSVFCYDTLALDPSWRLPFFPHPQAVNCASSPDKIQLHGQIRTRDVGSRALNLRGKWGNFITSDRSSRHKCHPPPSVTYLSSQGKRRECLLASSDHSPFARSCQGCSCHQFVPGSYLVSQSPIIQQRQLRQLPTVIGGYMAISLIASRAVSWLTSEGLGWPLMTRGDKVDVCTVTQGAQDDLFIRPVGDRHLSFSETRHHFHRMPYLWALASNRSLRRLRLPAGRKVNVGL